MATETNNVISLYIYYITLYDSICIWRLSDSKSTLTTNNVISLYIYYNRHLLQRQDRLILSFILSYLVSLITMQTELQNNWWPAGRVSLAPLPWQRDGSLSTQLGLVEKNPSSLIIDLICIYLVSDHGISRIISPSRCSLSEIIGLRGSEVQVYQPG